MMGIYHPGMVISVTPDQHQASDQHQTCTTSRAAAPAPAHHHQPQQHQHSTGPAPRLRHQHSSSTSMTQWRLVFLLFLSYKFSIRRVDAIWSFADLPQTFRQCSHFSKGTFRACLANLCLWTSIM